MRDIGLQNVSDLEFDLSRSIMVKCEGATKLPIYGFLLVLPVVELNRWLGTQKLSGVIVQPKQDRSTLNHHAYTCIHHRIQIAVSDMTMSG